MTCCFLLLLTLTSCVCEPTFVVKVAQSSYQAVENHSITLEWTFTTNTHTQREPNSIYCELTADDDKTKVLYLLHEGVEDTKTQHKQFSGRVQCDRDVLREGRLRLNVSRLRTEDSGQYWCRVVTESQSGSEECHLNVTAAVDEPDPDTLEPETPGPETPGPETPGPMRPESRGRIGLYLGLTAAVSLVLCLLSFGLCQGGSCGFYK